MIAASPTRRFRDWRVPDQEERDRRPVENVSGSTVIIATTSVDVRPCCCRWLERLPLRGRCARRWQTSLVLPAASTSSPFGSVSDRTRLRRVRRWRLRQIHGDQVLASLVRCSRRNLVSPRPAAVLRPRHLSRARCTLTRPRGGDPAPRPLFVHIRPRPEQTADRSISAAIEVRPHDLQVDVRVRAAFGSPPGVA